MYGAENLSWEYGFPADFLEIKSWLGSIFQYGSDKHQSRNPVYLPDAKFLDNF
jgi:hypothetical protein